ncbi:MAG TPA: nuclear transport factor 2 family protein [Kineosporiaceae bacterium]
MSESDLESLRRLKYRYLRTLDLKQWDEFATTLAPDVTGTYGERLSVTGREALVTYMREQLGPEVITVHTCHHPEIEVDGDRATGIWALEDTVIVPTMQVLLQGAAFYEDRYVRGEGGSWLIAHTGYVRTYEAMVSLRDLPSFRLTANRWTAAAVPADVGTTDPGATKV